MSTHLSVAEATHTWDAGGASSNRAVTQGLNLVPKMARVVTEGRAEVRINIEINAARASASCCGVNLALGQKRVLV